MSDSIRPRFVHEMFEDVARQHPSRTALACGSRDMSYSELDAWSNNIAHQLLVLGATKGTIIFVAAKSVFSIVSSMIASLKIGGVFVLVDPHQPVNRLRALAALAPPAYVLTETPFQEEISYRFGVAVPVISVDREDSGQQLPRLLPRRTAGRLENATVAPVSVSEPDDICYIYFTSGSTGKPKGVAGRLKGLDHFIRWEIQTFQIMPGTVFSQLTSPIFDPFLRDTFAPLCAGGKLQIPDSSKTVLDAERLIKWIQESQIELIHSIPSLFRLLFVAGLTSDMFPRLRYVLLAGEALLPSDVKRWTEIFGDRIHLVNVYGPTETTLAKLFYMVTPEDSARRIIPVGKPIPGGTILLLDEQGKAAKHGAIGEVCIQTPYRSLGYYGNQELTNKVFIPNPLNDDPDDIVYRTGDLGRVLDDGNLELHGRNDQQVKVRGAKVELQELENTIHATGLVREAVVTSRTDQLGNSYLSAYVVLSKTEPIELIRRAIASTVPDYMVPSTFVVLNELPKTQSGKVDRNALPAPQEALVNRPGDLVPPQDPIETEVARIFSSVLAVQKIGPHDDFFQIGGHSLLATLVISRVRRLFKADVPLAALFDAPTVAGLAGRIRSIVGVAAAVEQPVQPVPRDEVLPASFAQTRLWFLEQFQPGSDLYNILVTVRLDGILDISVLRRSLDEIVRRHEALRTRLVMQEGELLQQIVPAGRLSVPVFDLSGEPPSCQKLRLQDLIDEQARRPFDLSRGPLLRVQLARLSEQEHVLAIDMHHVVHDDWSLNIFLRELGQLYEAYLHQQPSPLAELPIQYADFAVWQRNWLQGEALEKQLGYWRKQLADLPVVLELPTDYPRPPVQSIHGAKLSLQLPAELTEQLKDVGRSRDATLFMTLLAAFQVLLMRYSGQEDLAVGSPIANRNRVETEGLIGFFVNTVVLRGDLHGNPTFLELLARTRETALATYAYQDLPFERLVKELRPPRNLSHTPLFQIMFAFQNASMAEFASAGLCLTPLEIKTFAVRYDLMTTVEEPASGGLVVHMEYCTDLFEPATVQRMLGHFQNLLQAVVKAPEDHLQELAMLGEEEREQLLVGWNATARDYGAPVCVHELFEAQVKRTPSAWAVEYELDRLSYSELNERANQLAHYLSTLGVGREVRVALCLERGLDMVVGLLGVLKVGGAYVPLDPEYPIERLQFIAQDAQVSVLLTKSALRGCIPESGARIVELDSDRHEIAGYSRENLSNTSLPGNAAYVIYTSGSTGQPKGVVILHKGLTNFLLAMNGIFGESKPAQWIAVTSICFDISVLELFWTLAHGDHVILHPGLTRVQPGLRLVSKQPKARTTDESWDYQAKDLQCTPSFMVGLMEQWKTHTHKPILRKLLLGGEVLPQTLAHDLVGTTQEGVYNMYGPTETTVWSSVYRLGVEAGAVSIGRPIANTQMYLLDRCLQPVPVGVPGDLYIGGAGVAREYWNRPDLTAEKFVPSPFGTQAGERLYRTGDLARWRVDGNLEFLGRGDHQVKIRGYRIELGEIEAALSQHPQVQESLVIVREHNNNKRLLAYVVCLPSASVNGSNLRQYLRKSLPDYMIPNEVVLLDRMPLTANGKLDRQALPTPQSNIPARAAHVMVGQGSQNEQRITAIWQDLLQISKVHLDDNFFDLGGHSLLVVQMRTALLEALNRDVTVMDLFAYPSIRSLLKYLDEDEPTENPDPVQDRIALRKRHLLRRKNSIQKETIS